MSAPTSASPAASPGSPPSVTDRVQSVINWLRPVIQSDGGDLELVNVSAEGVVQVRFHGACVGCPSLTETLQKGIERSLREKVPEITQVVAVENLGARAFAPPTFDSFALQCRGWLRVIP